VTKERSPLSVENTLRVVLGELTIERAAEVTGKTKHHLTACTDEDRPDSTLNVRDLELLDLEHHSLFGRGFPILDALIRRFETAGHERFGEAICIARHGATVGRESAEAAAALVEASLTPGNDRLLQNALRELEQADRATTEAMTVVRAQLARGAPGGPSP